MTVEGDWLREGHVQPNAEMVRLREMLDAEGIEWLDNSDRNFCRTQSGDVREPIKRNGLDQTFSAICGDMAYGTIELWVWFDSGGPVGLATAEEAMALIREAVK